MGERPCCPRLYIWVVRACVRVCVWGGGCPCGPLTICMEWHRTLGYGLVIVFLAEQSLRSEGSTITLVGQSFSERGTLQLIRGRGIPRIKKKNMLE